MPDQLLPIPQVPEGLREAAQRGILIPFIGAGVSRLAGCPSWAEFADAALRWLIFDGKFTYSQLDQIRSLHPRVKLSLARTLAGEKNTVIDFRTLLHPKGVSSRWVKPLLRLTMTSGLMNDFPSRLLPPFRPSSLHLQILRQSNPSGLSTKSTSYCQRCYWDTYK